jgi:hypothetical protein|tara:strand:+ start:745 stop:1017 length:273 start_codon:yes stop_codon:yes gene_type:complete
MDFILGIALLFILIPFNLCVIKLTPKIAPEFGQAIIGIMFMGSLVFTIGWVFGVKSDITNQNAFIGGVAIALFTSMLFKIVYMLLNPIKN